ncbi:DUF6477 family protein [Sinirhodobacter huangdaonensis]|uniref:Uncharacterized protein n=1 Tax=Paenirhodobacter huangdaonensis TaxID=2501515 RepID=A0A3S3PCS9_9RHOB|nr:DUF6477 family protein [Sinirhodobacter huangdaonensis]RWR49263.1 hypothetical protein EOW66_17190 [Sinirhodobacter huangdaonensis]
MTDLHDSIATLRRPRLLIRAARCGQGEYNRARDLKRLMRLAEAPPPEAALRALIAEEAVLEAHRREGCAQYSLARHIELLIAMMAEARLLPRPGA